MTAEKHEVRLILRGRVQGVFFRTTIQRWAKELGLVGYARNEPDGSVTVVAQGPKPALEELVTRCQQGTEQAQVTDAKVTWTEAAKKSSNFSIS